MVTRQDNHLHARIRDQAAGALDRRSRNTVIVERISGEQDDIGAMCTCRSQYGCQAGDAVSMLGGGSFVIDVQVGTVDKHNVHWGRLRGGHVLNMMGTKTAGKRPVRLGDCAKVFLFPAALCPARHLTPDPIRLQCQAGLERAQHRS
jgi:hypothetical protein